MQYFSRALFFVVSLIQFSTLATAADCLEKRAAFDVGSGTTKMVVAEVNYCEGKVMKVLGAEAQPVDYKKDLTEMGNNRFSSEIQTQGTDTLRALKEKAKSLGALQFAGAATAAFRLAENGEPYLAQIGKELGIHLRVIGQEEEGILGYWSATALLGNEHKTTQNELIVWDVGGGSQQIVLKVRAAKSQKDDWLVAGNAYGSVAFKEKVISDILKKDPKVVSTPNPLSEAQAKEALSLARSYAKSSVLDKMKKHLLSAVEVVGIGGVHYHSVRSQVGVDSIFNPEQIRETLKKRYGKTDKEVGGDYAATDVTNLILVLGFMEELKIKQVRSLKADLSHGVLVDPKFWEK